MTEAPAEHLVIEADPEDVLFSRIGFFRLDVRRIPQARFWIASMTKNVRRPPQS